MELIVKTNTDALAECLMEKFRDGTKWKGSFWHMGVVKEYTVWLMNTLYRDEED